MRWATTFGPCASLTAGFGLVLVWFGLVYLCFAWVFCLCLCFPCLLLWLIKAEFYGTRVTGAMTHASLDSHRMVFPPLTIGPRLALPLLEAGAVVAVACRSCELEGPSLWQDLRLGPAWVGWGLGFGVRGVGWVGLRFWRPFQFGLVLKAQTGPKTRPFMGVLLG